MQVEGKVNELYKKMEGLEQEAKNYLAKSQQTKGSTREMYKQKALMALKKKKQLMQQANKYNSHQNMLQQAVFTKEAAAGHKEMVFMGKPDNCAGRGGGGTEGSHEGHRH